MFKKFVYLIHIKHKKIKDLNKKQEGFTLVEVMVALLVVAIISTVVIQGTIMATNTAKINKAKTLCLAKANEEIEKIRLMNYDDIGIIGSNPEGIFPASKTEDDYIINYDITWVNGENSYKQVKVSVRKDPMNKEVGVITQISPAFGYKAPGEEYPAPENLIIEYDFGWPLRIIGLNWDSPDTETPIDKYKVYRKKEGEGFNYQGSSNITRYVDTIFEFRIKKYTYYVTAVYMDGTESGRSNEAKTTR